MAVLAVRLWPDPVLSRMAGPVTDLAAARELAADMLDTMYHAQGRGLAAPQVGVSLRLFVMDATWKEGAPTPQVFMNPVIVSRSGDVATGPEGCLSIPGITISIARATAIRLRWTDLDGVMQDADLTGFQAICAQHEIDHLDGIVTLDRLSPEARALAEAEYLA
ncbi:MAG: peptide deformylase [Rhodobacteraceae bacterium PARR1]|nr:MAG: peptide deformylase [Rhodobacteraceae bacterium PARR1]